MQHIGYFTSAHGFGHAARASAIMNEIHALNPDFRFEIFTQTPAYFFEESLTAGFNHHAVLTDVGLVQVTPFAEDLAATRLRLADFLPFQESAVASLVRQVRQLNCRLIVCDISPLGLEIADQAGIPSVLVENFTWDWIYEGYLQDEPGLRPFMEYLREIFGSATYHVQVDPICHPCTTADLVTAPVSRKPRTPSHRIRKELGLAEAARMVLVTLGGIPARFSPLDFLRDLGEWNCVILGGAASREIHGNLFLLPYHSEWYHPDLVSASDVVIGKVGYSTVAEAYHAGLPFGYITRSRFRESQTITAFINREMPAVEIPRQAFETGKWAAYLQQLSGMPRNSPSRPNGAGAIAAFIVGLLR